MFVALIDHHKNSEKLHKNVNKNMFPFTFLCNFHASVKFFGIFVPIFMEFSPKSRTKKLGMIYTILESIFSFLNWEGADIRSQMKKVNKQCLLYTPHTVRVSEKTWQVIVQTSRP